MSMARSEIDSRLALLPGGGPTQLRLPGGVTKVISRGRGCRLWDVDGVEYVDYVLGSGPLILGHSHPMVVDAVERQLALGSTFYAATEPLLALAERIVDWLPCAERIQFCSTGSEATFFALRIARAATGRDAILKFEGGFHGAHDYSVMSLFASGLTDFPAPDPSSAGVPRALEQEVLVAPFNDLETTTAIVERHAGRLAAIIVEPVQRVLTPIHGFLQGLRALADRYGIALVFDEVVTGFRLARGGAQEYFGVIPDLSAVGKIVGGGYPLAAVAGRRELLELAAHDRRGHADFVYFSGTLSGNPIAAAAGLATLGELDRPGAYERLFEAGERIRSSLRACFAEAGVDAQILGVGPLFQVLLTDQAIVDYRSAAHADKATLAALASGVFRRGVFYSGEKAYVSLAHTDADIDATVAVFASALADLAAAAVPRATMERSA